MILQEKLISLIGVRQLREQTSALNPAEADSESSRTFLAVVRQRRLPLFCPTLLVE